VNEEFVQQLNNATDFDEQEKLEALAFKMLERIKVRKICFTLHSIIVKLPFDVVIRKYKVL